MIQQPLKGFDGCEIDTPKKPEVPPFKYLEVEVSRQQGTTVYLKVPREFDNKRLWRESKLLEKACHDTVREYDWDDPWESDVNCEGVREVDEKEASQFEIYEVKQ